MAAHPRGKIIPGGIGHDRRARSQLSVNGAANRGAVVGRGGIASCLRRTAATSSKSLMHWPAVRFLACAQLLAVGIQAHWTAQHRFGILFAWMCRRPALRGTNAIRTVVGADPSLAPEQSRPVRSLRVADIERCSLRPDSTDVMKRWGTQTSLAWDLSRQIAYRP